MAVQKRAERIREFSLSNVSFICEKPNIAEAFGVSNLSRSGLALTPTNQLHFNQGQVLVGKLFIHDKEFAIELKVIRPGGQSCGCSFQQVASQLISHLKKEFSIEIAALKMTSIDPTILNQQSDGKPHWFFDGGVCELYFTEVDDKIQRFRISHFGHTIQHIQGKSPMYNNIPMAPLAKQVKDGFYRFLNNIEELKPNYRNEIEAVIEQFKNS